jgi:hypothetical protein
MASVGGVLSAATSNIGVRRGSVLVPLAIVSIVAHAHVAVAGQHLRSFITDLYAGQGITLATDDGNENITNPQLVQGLNQSLSALSSGTNSGISSLGSAVSSSTFDITQGMPIQSSNSLGPLVAERAETLGQGHMNFGASFSHVKFTEFNGNSLGNVTAAFNNLSAGENDQVIVKANIKIQRDTLAFYGTYGISPVWDVGIIAPFVHVAVRATADASLNDSGNDGDQFLGNTHSQTGGDVTGLGDVVLRSKFNFLQNSASLPDLALYNEVKLPTGDASNLLGSGNTDFLGMIVASKQLGFIAPHINLGLQGVVGNGTDRNNLRYTVGADAAVTQDVTLALDAVGKKDFGGFNTVDLAIGAKWNIFERNIVSANVFVPINKNEGVRPDYAASLRWDITF